jgi:hypothetical protein
MLYKLDSMDRVGEADRWSLLAVNCVFCFAAGVEGGTGRGGMREMVMFIGQTAYLVCNVT